MKLQDPTEQLLILFLLLLNTTALRNTLMSSKTNANMLTELAEATRQAFLLI